MLNVCSRIVVPYDNSELSKKALDRAITLAKQNKSIELNVITVFHVPVDVTYFDTLNIDEIRQTEYEIAKIALNEVNKKLEELPNHTETFVLEGIPSCTIVDFINSINADLVVMGSRGLSNLKELFLGSVSHYVVQKVTCPVFIIK
ncbi:universal stress protein [Gottfriedia acidiceleris]|uniref:universal stress protein n=1 Tax=Gottfriedia acidiceleris TaxID=371036 RepID=UPI003D1EAD69